jgi:hypothetical protein
MRARMARERDVAIPRLGHFLRSPRRLQSSPTPNPRRSILSDNPTSSQTNPPWRAGRPCSPPPPSCRRHTTASSPSAAAPGEALPARSAPATRCRSGSARAAPPPSSSARRLQRYARPPRDRVSAAAIPCSLASAWWLNSPWSAAAAG